MTGLQGCATAAAPGSNVDIATNAALQLIRFPPIAPVARHRKVDSSSDQPPLALFGALESQRAAEVVIAANKQTLSRPSPPKANVVGIASSFSPVAIKSPGFTVYVSRLSKCGHMGVKGVGRSSRKLGVIN
jgi:hypothetical protein